MGYYNGTTQKGSQGDDVKKWQEFLNTQGYELELDGIFGGKTSAATKHWQRTNGITDDGVVGELTWGKAGFNNVNTPTKAPTLSYTSWLDTKAGKEASYDREKAEEAVNNFGDFNYLNQDWMDQVLSDIKNRKEFSYNLDEDALYQQYKDKYIKQGKLAMEDTIGQASAMTGGYGNSYAQSVGNQAYNAHLENLNDIVPELYQMAYDRYNNETQDLYNQYGLLLEDYAREYGEHSDEYNKLLSALDRADSEFYNGASLHQTEQSNKNTVTQNNWQMAFTEQQYEDSKTSSGSSGSGSSGSSSGGSSGGSGSTGGTTGTSTVPTTVINSLKNLKTEQGQTDYLAEQVNDGVITQDQAYALLDKYGATDLVNRSWELVDDGGMNFLGIGINANAEVKDNLGNEYSLAELRKELKKTMTHEEATKFIKELEKKLGIKQ